MGVKVGDLLEAKVEKGKMTLIPKTVIDRGIAESLEDYKNGRSYGPFDSAEELLASLHRNLKKVEKKILFTRALMKLSYSQHFLRSYAKAPLPIRKLFDKQAGLLVHNLRHPSLRAKKYDEAEGNLASSSQRRLAFLFHG